MLRSFVCSAQKTNIFFNMDSVSFSMGTSFHESMSYCDGYFAGGLKMFMIENRDTCCMFSSIGSTQFQSCVSDTSSDVSIYCWPGFDSVYEQPACEDQPRKKWEDAELVMKFCLSGDEKLKCFVSFFPERCETIDLYNHDIDSVLNQPHYFVDNIYGIFCGMLKQGKDKKEIESFLDKFDKCLDPFMLNPYGEYGTKYGYGYGYGHYKYNYCLLKCLLHMSDKPYVGRDIIKLNDGLNLFYKLYNSHELNEKVREVQDITIP